MNQLYPFSEWTAESLVLQELSSNDRITILQATQVYKDACDEALIRNLNHPRSEAFYKWLNNSPVNRDWYETNKNKLKLIPDGIEILWDVFCLDDESIVVNIDWVKREEANSYFNYESAVKYSHSVWKHMVDDWSKYVSFLPGDLDNKIDFLSNVLWLKFAWMYQARNSEIQQSSLVAYYWADNAKENFSNNLFMSSDYINPKNSSNTNNGLLLRLLMNKKTR